MKKILPYESNIERKVSQGGLRLLFKGNKKKKKKSQNLDEVNLYITNWVFILGQVSDKYDI